MPNVTEARSGVMHGGADDFKKDAPERRQEQVVRALVRAGGVLDSGAGKGSHVRVTMPSMKRVFVPSGTIRTGTLAAIVNQSGLSREEFIALL